MPNNVRVSYIVPAHNEESTLIGMTERIAQRLADEFPGSEILIVENGSHDNTDAVAAQLELQFAGDERVTVRHLNSATGLGHAMRVGAAASSGDLVVMAGGLAFGFTDLDAAMALRSRPPFVIGSKAHSESDLDRSLTRRVFTTGFTLMRRMLLPTTVRDSQGSFIIDGDLARTLLPLTQEPGYVAQAELVAMAELAGIEIVEVPVVLPPSTGGSSIRPVRTSLEMARGLLRIRRRAAHTRSELQRVGLLMTP